MNKNKFLGSVESAVLDFRRLFTEYGYRPFKMSKFEEYELYAKNKDFLVSDRVITFNDTNGKLLALKPDVTLSIIKNTLDEPGIKTKLCYDEKVYRPAGSTNRFKEITQTGLECIGDIDLYDIYEVVDLAAAGLSLISDSFVLDLSHLGVLSALLSDMGKDLDFSNKIIKLFSEKNSHDILKVCKQNGVSERDANTLAAFTEIYGDRATVLQRLSKLDLSENAKKAVDELAELSKLLDCSDFSDKIKFDFSIVNDMNYYNGFVFKGFLQNIPESVLSGGRYDSLMKKMGKNSGAVGFAVYLDLLETIETPAPEYDVDTLIIYNNSTDKKEILKTVKSAVKEGKTVTAQKNVPSGLKYKEKITL